MTQIPYFNVYFKEILMKNLLACFYAMTGIKTFKKEYRYKLISLEKVANKSIVNYIDQQILKNIMYF